MSLDKKWSARNVYMAFIFFALLVSAWVLSNFFPIQYKDADQEIRIGKAIQEDLKKTKVAAEKNVSDPHGLLTKECENCPEEETSILGECVAIDCLKDPEECKKVLGVRRLN